MGKDLKGKELGKGISQRKDGYYIGRFTARNGDRRQKLFKKLPDCRQWIADSRFEDQHSDPRVPQNMTVNAWYEVWIRNKERTVAQNTLWSYQNRYKNDIGPVIGTMLLKDVKPLHCQEVLNQMAERGQGTGTITEARIAMRNLFEYAVQNEALIKNPCNKAVKADIGAPKKAREALTMDQQKRLLEGLTDCIYENQYKFLLQTGLRIGELSGLEWSDIDFQHKSLTVNRTMDYHGKEDGWRIGKPKTKGSMRTIPLTDEAIKILKDQRGKDSRQKRISLEWKDLVFLSRSGKPITSAAYDSVLKKVCDTVGIPRISTHILRHTFATRCIEAGMRPKTLQSILGHSSLSTTMDLYVHLTEDEKKKEIDKLSQMVQDWYIPSEECLKKAD